MVAPSDIHRAEIPLPLLKISAVRAVDVCFQRCALTDMPALEQLMFTAGKGSL